MNAKIYLEKNSDFKYGENLSGAYGLQILDKAPVDICLTLCENYLCVRDFSAKKPDSFFDFNNPKILYRLDKKRAQNELLIKAARLKNSHINLIVDATLGTGLDALLLTNISEKVLGFEENLLVFLLLQDAIYRAKKLGILNSELEKLQIENVNSQTELLNLKQMPEIIYLDPMFSDLNTKSQPKKNMQFLRGLLAESLETKKNNFELLLKSARKSSLEKVVVKKPLRAKADKNINYQLKGKNTRFDVYRPI